MSWAKCRRVFNSCLAKICAEATLYIFGEGRWEGTHQDPCKTPGPIGRECCAESFGQSRRTGKQHRRSAILQRRCISGQQERGPPASASLRPSFPRHLRTGERKVATAHRSSILRAIICDGAIYATLCITNFNRLPVNQSAVLAKIWRNFFMSWLELRNLVYYHASNCLRKRRRGENGDYLSGKFSLRVLFIRI